MDQRGWFRFIPEPEPFGVEVDAFGEGLGLRVLPDGLIGVLAPIFPPGVVALPVVVLDPVVPVVPAPPPAAGPAANAIEELNARTDANAIVASFMIVSLVDCYRGQPGLVGNVPSPAITNPRAAPRAQAERSASWTRFVGEPLGDHRFGPPGAATKYHVNSAN
jgi:hypothetical protein